MRDRNAALNKLLNEILDDSALKDIHKKKLLVEIAAKNPIGFMRACRDLDLICFKKIVSLIDFNLQYKGLSLLHVVSGASDFKERLQLLLSRGANLNVLENLSHHYGTPLHYILANEDFEKFYDVLEIAAAYRQQINFHLRDGEGKTALLLAAKVMSGGAVQKILKLDPTCVDIADNEGRTPLHIACALGNAEIVEMLLNAGANINARDNAGNTPAHYAAIDKSMVRQLLSSISIDPKRDVNAESNAISLDPWTPIPITIRQAASLNLRLTTSPADHVKGTDNGNILNSAKNIPAMKSLFNLGFLNEFTTEEASYFETRLNQLHGKSVAQACMDGHLVIMKILIRLGANIMSANNAGNLPITGCQDLEVKACLAQAMGNIAKFTRLFAQPANRDDDMDPTVEFSFYAPAQHK